MITLNVKIGETAKKIDFVSICIEQSWFGYARAYIRLTSKLDPVYKSCIFEIKFEQQIIFNGQIRKIKTTNNNTEEVCLVHLIDDTHGIAQTKNSLFSKFKQNKVLSLYPIFWSAYKQDGKTIFDRAISYSIDELVPLKLKKEENFNATGVHISVCISYLRQNLEIYDVGKLIFGQKGVEVSNPKNLIDDWPKTGEMYKNDQILVLQSSISEQLTDKEKNLYTLNGSLLIQREVSEQCREVWNQILYPEYKSTKIIKLHIDLENYFANIKHWEPNQNYYTGKPVIYKKDKNFELIYCTTSHRSKDQIEEDKWKTTGKVYDNLQHDFLYQSELGKEMQKEIVKYILLQVWAKNPVASIAFSNTLDDKNIEIGDIVVYENAEYVIVSYKKKYTKNGYISDFIAYKFSFHDLNIEINEDFKDIQYNFDFNSRIAVELICRNSAPHLKISFPNKSYKTLKVVNIYTKKEGS